jgi:hypothetical protein
MTTAYWAVQEGILGDAVNKISGGLTNANALDVTWHVVTNNGLKPNSTAHGPYPTMAAAQAEVTTLNNTQAGSVAVQSVTGQAGGVQGAITNGLDWQSLALRFAEVGLGIVLIAVGLSKITGTENMVSKLAKTGALA